jgi:lysophospholipase L1-like esterase
MYSNKTLGVNGALMATRADTLTPELLADIDLVTVFAGTNDYGHGGVTLGTQSDLAGANTFYGSIYTVIDKILAAKATVKIVFFTQLQRGVFGTEPNPYAAGHPRGDGPGANGLTMPAISQAIVTACRLNAIPCLDLFSISGCNDRTFLNYYPSNDFLHPTPDAADKLGLIMGKFINSLA